MSWEREPLFIKSKLFFEKGFEEEKESPFFGLWCAMGLELLARSAISHVSPTLLADPDASHSNLLHALGKGSDKNKKKSLLTIQVLSLCKTLIKEFNEEEFKIASSVINLRNEELHTGSDAFTNYPTQQWIAGFYKLCKILCEFQNESLENLFGHEIKNEAQIILQDTIQEVVNSTKSTIAAHNRVFLAKSEPTRKELAKKVEEESNKLTGRGYHRVKCPACDCISVVTGEPFGDEKIEHKDSEIIERRSILPTKFTCNACELKLEGYNSLKAAGIANHYTRKRTFSPEEYYNMIDFDDYEAIKERYDTLSGNEPYFEYNNE